MFRIGRNTFYDRKNKIPMKIQEVKRSRIELIAEFRGILNRFSNQAMKCHVCRMEERAWSAPTSYNSMELLVLIFACWRH